MSTTSEGKHYLVMEDAPAPDLPQLDARVVSGASETVSKAREAQRLDPIRVPLQQSMLERAQVFLSCEGDDVCKYRNAPQAYLHGPVRAYNIAQGTRRVLSYRRRLQRTAA